MTKTEYVKFLKKLLVKYNHSYWNNEIYDKRIYQYERLVKLGTWIVDYLAGRSGKWNDELSDEPTPQHWLFKLFLYLKQQGDPLYALLIQNFNITESNLAVSKDNKIPIRIKIQEQILELVMRKKLSEKDRLRVAQVEQQIMLNNLIRSGKKRIEASIMKNLIKDKVIEVEDYLEATKKE